MIKRLKKLKPKDEGVLGKEGKMLPNRNRIRSMGDASSSLRETGLVFWLPRYSFQEFNIYIKRDTTAIFVTKQRQRWC